MAIRTRKPRAKAERNPSRFPEFSVRDFFNRFPDDDACIAHVMNVRYGLRHVCAQVRTRCDFPSSCQPQGLFMFALRPSRLPLRRYDLRR